MPTITIVAKELTPTGIGPADVARLKFRVTPEAPVRLPDGLLSPEGVTVDVEDGLGTVILDRLPAGYGYLVKVWLGGKSYEETVLVGDVDAFYHDLQRADPETLTAAPPDPAAWTALLDVEAESRAAADEAEAAARLELTGRVTTLEAAEVSWTEVTGKPGTFPPSPHLHPTSDVTGFTAAASAAAPVQTVAGRSGAVTLAVADVSGAVATTDPRLTDARTPTAHTHTVAQVTDFSSAVDTRIQAIIGAAPAALDTLDELAAALGDDANFAGTVTTQLSGLDTRLDTAEADLAAAQPYTGDGSTLVRRDEWGQISAQTLFVYNPLTRDDQVANYGQIRALIDAAVGSARYHALVGG